VPACPDERTLDAALELARRKVSAGAEYVIVDPVFDVDHGLARLKRAAELGVPVIATVLLLKSAGMARYISIHEPGAMVSEALISRIRKAQDREEECLRIAAELLVSFKTAAGVKLQALGWEHRIPVVLDLAGF
jgi:5,10-methylenetetrahydrofolate reductase